VTIITHIRQHVTKMGAQLLENLYIQLYQHQRVLIDKQNTCKMNPLYTIAYERQTQYLYIEKLHIYISICSMMLVQHTTLSCMRHINMQHTVHI
jgi:hypothetical protein